MTYQKEFVEYYREWLKRFKASELVRYENNLAAFIDSDLFDVFLLADEVSILYELIRDECVYRVSKIAD